MKKRDAEEDTGAVSDDMDKKKKRNLDPAKLENMNKKLQAIEDFIINETIKYTGAHEGKGFLVKKYYVISSGLFGSANDL